MTSCLRIYNTYIQWDPAIFRLSPMILLAPRDLECPIDLLHEQQPDHLVGEGHTGKGKTLPRRCDHRRRQAESATDQKRDVAVPGRTERGDFF